MEYGRVYFTDSLPVEQEARISAAICVNRDLFLNGCLQKSPRQPHTKLGCPYDLTVVHVLTTAASPSRLIVESPIEAS